MAKKLRVVFDCNVLLQGAARQKSLAASCLTLAEKGLVQLFVSKEVLLEIEDVLNRPEVRAHFPDLSDEIAGAFFKRLSVAVCNYETVIHDPVETETRERLIDVAESVFEHAFL